MASGTIVFEREKSLARIVISNPDKRNAMSLEMWRQLAAALRRADEDEEVRVIVLTGHGKEAFVSGADISRFAEERSDAGSADIYTAAIAGAVDNLTNTHKPAIAMINGACFGGGVDIAVCCDIRICSQNALFSVPAARIGLGYATEMVQRLANVVGFAAAKEMLITGRRMPADRAYHIGLVNRVVAGDGLEAAVLEEAGLIAANAPFSMRAAKWGVTALEQGATAGALAEHRRLVALANGSEDYAEGVRAFLEKRRPVFRGR